MISKVINSGILRDYPRNNDEILDINSDWEQFEKEYSPLTKIKLYLINLSKKYNLGDVSFIPSNKYDWDSMDSFYIEAPKEWSYDKTSKVWDELINDCVNYAEKEDILSTLNSISIIVK